MNTTSLYQTFCGWVDINLCNINSRIFVITYYGEVFYHTLTYNWDTFSSEMRVFINGSRSVYKSFEDFQNKEYRNCLGKNV